MTMQNDNLVDRLRASRDSRSVLKIKFVTLRGRSPDVPILVFEGDDDKVVFGRWIGRLRPLVSYDAFVCRGKRGVRSLQSILLGDLGKLADGVFLFIDRDFDDADGFVLDNNLFMTDRYSVENYLVDDDVVASILRDEFPCHEHPDLRLQIVEQFRRDYAEFLEVTKEFNRRLFIARTNQVALAVSLSTKLSDYAKVAVGLVSEGDKAAEILVPLPPEIDLDDAEQNALFNRLSGQERYRGKNALAFFLKWISSLCDSFEADTGFFKETALTGKIRRHELTLGGLASKSPMPVGLQDFVDQIAA